MILTILLFLNGANTLMVPSENRYIYIIENHSILNKTEGWEDGLCMEGWEDGLCRTIASGTFPANSQNSLKK